MRTTELKKVLNQWKSDFEKLVPNKKFKCYVDCHEDNIEMNYISFICPINTDDELICKNAIATTRPDKDGDIKDFYPHHCRKIQKEDTIEFEFEIPVQY